MDALSLEDDPAPAPTTPTTPRYRFLVAAPAATVVALRDTNLVDDALDSSVAADDEDDATAPTL
jgi:hypothetical protein